MTLLRRQAVSDAPPLALRRSNAGRDLKKLDGVATRTFGLVHGLVRQFKHAIPTHGVPGEQGQTNACGAKALDP